MIGNDIVDLNLARIESNWKRKGFLDKIFTINEQQAIKKSINQELKIWEYWSRKEAVYKIIIQKGGIRGYYPIKIECLDSSQENGLVEFENQVFYTKTSINKDFIYSLAYEKRNDFLKIKSIKNTYLIFKINGIPYFKYKNEIKNISKTHHGRFEKMIYLDN